MKMNMLRAVFIALVVGLFAAPAHSADLTEDQFEKMMKEFLSKDENVGEIGSALERYFDQKKQEQQQMAAKQEAERLEDQFKNPVEIDVSGSPFMGPKDAPVTVVEFSDFQCPFCKRGADTMDDLKKEYPTQVKIVFKNLPLPFHDQAKPAAIAALAAGRQSKFWEMHDKLFENQSSLGPDLYKQLAKELNLDMAKFEKDLEDEALAKQVDDDAALASKLGVNGTPGFFVNGVQVQGARPLPHFKSLVDRWLKKG